MGIFMGTTNFTALSFELAQEQGLSLKLCKYLVDKRLGLCIHEYESPLLPVWVRL